VKIARAKILAFVASLGAALIHKVFDV